MGEKGDVVTEKNKPTNITTPHLNYWVCEMLSPLLLRTTWLYKHFHHFFLLNIWSMKYYSQV
jgi:hypothetical protein